MWFTRDLYTWTEEEAPSDEKVKDALGELANTIAGWLMTRLTPPEQIFELGLPETGDGFWYLTRIDGESWNAPGDNTAGRNAISSCP
jgi:hypothetical protein